MNNFQKTINDFAVKIEILKQECLDKINILSATMTENVTTYETVITSKLSTEYSRYAALYKHASNLIAEAKLLVNNVSATNTEIMKDIATIKENLETQEGVNDLLGRNDATLADQIITIKEDLNLVKEWIAAITTAGVENNVEPWKALITNESKQLKTFTENELKYDNYVNFTAEWSEFLSEYHPNNLPAEEEEEEEDAPVEEKVAESN